MARPRKTGERHPGGKLKQESRLAPALLARITHAAKALKDPVFGSPIGTMLLLGDVTAWEVEAGMIYQNQRKRYDTAMGFASRSARSCNLDATGGKGHTEGHTDAKGRQAYERTHGHVMAALGHSAGPQAIALLDRVMIQGEAVAWFELNTLRAGLMAVAEAHGLAGDPNKRKRAVSLGGIRIYKSPAGPRELSTGDEKELDEEGQIIAA